MCEIISVKHLTCRRNFSSGQFGEISFCLRGSADYGAAAIASCNYAVTSEDPPMAFRSPNFSNSKKIGFLWCMTSLLILLLAPTAKAVMHPQLGRFLQRDPVGTAISPPRWSSNNFLRFPQLSHGPVESAYRQHPDGYNVYQYQRSNPLRHTDPRGEAATIVSGPSLASPQTIVLIAGVVCATNTSCRTAVWSAVSAAASAAQSGFQTLCKVRCRFSSHGPHHRFTVPSFGIPPWKQCYMNHLQVNCWLKGVPGSSFLSLRIPYGPRYRFIHAIPPTPC